MKFLVQIPLERLSQNGNCLNIVGVGDIPTRIYYCAMFERFVERNRSKMLW